MLQQSDFINYLSDILFWDIDKSQVGADRYPAFFIQRLLEYGNWNDWQLLLSYFSIKRIVTECKKLRSLDSVYLSFICTISDTKKEDYRYYHLAQSNPTLWNS